MDATRQHGIQVLFSDIDGTCVMYPDVQSPLTDSAGDQDENGLWPTTALDGSQASLLRLPPSSSGAQGVISARTLQLYASLRALGVKLVLISGGRLSTIMQRLPCLPAADAIVVESGGRIFFPCGSDSLPTAAPLREDLQWRQALSPWAGPPGQDGTAPEARGGVLWRHYADLKTAGFDLDATSYTTAFRVRKPAGRQAELSGGLPSGLAASINLGAVDIYPATSGKAKAAQHLMRHFGTPASGAQCAFMCDDDNDLELAFAVRKAYCPGITADSVRRAVEAHPAQFFLAKRQGVWGTEEVLERLIQEQLGAAV